MHETLVETLSSATRWPLPVMIAAAALGLAVVLMSWWNVRHVRARGRRVAIVVLRALSVLLFLLVLLEPVRREQLIRRVRNHVAILLDISQSMEAPAGGGETPAGGGETPAGGGETLVGGGETLVGGGTRMDRARRFLEGLEARGAEMERVHVFHRFSFGSDLRPVEGSFADHRIEPDAPATRTLEALADLARAMSGKDLAAVVLVTDGVDNGALSTLQRGQEVPVHEVREVLERLGAPILFVPAGGAVAQPDIRVSELHAPTFTFVMNAASVDASISVDGPIPSSLEVTLYEDGKPTRTERLPTIPEKRSYVVTLPFLPRRVGEHVYTVRVEPMAGERYVENNQRSVLIPSIRDRIRVLQVAGHPSYDERFLRDFLKSNRNIDLVSFFILVDANDLRRFSADETSLIPFPVKELFEDELPGFDLVIFQDFQYRPFNVGRFLPHLRSFVENGGAFIAIGGGRSFENGGYAGTPLAEILPVDLRPADGGGRRGSEPPFRARVTEVGEHHPVLRLLPDEQENRALFDDLPELHTLNRVSGLKPGAAALAVHPRLKGRDGKPAPIIALGELGKGRSLAVLTDGLWRWNFAYAGRGGDAYPYNRFWTAAIAWLLRDSEMSPVRLTLEPPAPREGVEVRAHGVINDPSFRPAEDHPFSFRLLRLRDPTNPGTEQEVLKISDRRSGAGGNVSLSFTPPRPGVYRAELSADFHGRIQRAQRLMIVDPGTEERSRIRDPDRLVELMVRYSGGSVVDPASDPRGLGFRTPETLLVARERERPLWNHAGVLFLAVLLLGAEWALRKRSGLP